jgi:hypothetical protein
MVWQIIAAVITSQALVELIRLILDRKDGKDNVKATLTKLEKDVLRTQMLLMILMRPEEKREILTLAQHYFVDLKGNWYMTDMFNKWLEDEGHSKPEWFAEK